MHVQWTAQYSGPGERLDGHKLDDYYLRHQVSTLLVKGNGAKTQNQALEGGQ